MKKSTLIPALLALFIVSSLAQQVPEGPFPPEQWPASADPNKVVHFVSVADAFGWTAFPTAPTVEGVENVVTISPAGTKFYRLAK